MNIKRFLYYKEMNYKDYIVCLTLLILPVLMLIIPLKTSYIIGCALFILYIVTIVIYELIINSNRYRSDKLPKQYKRYLVLSIFNIIGCAIFLVGVAQELVKGDVGFYFVACIVAIVFYSYLTCILMILTAICTYIYYYALKKFFPEEESVEPKYFTRNELSKYITISDQIKVFNSILINFIFYLLGVGYFFFWFMTKVKTDGVILNTLIEFAEKYNYANFGNTVGLFSLIITVYTVTYSIQGKVFDKAVSDLKKDKEIL